MIDICCSGIAGTDLIKRQVIKQSEFVLGENTG
jgi:hypothetical protein